MRTGSMLDNALKWLAAFSNKKKKKRGNRIINPNQPT